MEDELDKIVSFRAMGNECTIGICPRSGFKDLKYYPDHPMLKTVLGSMEAEQGVEASIRLGTSVAKLLSPESDTLINNVLSGAEIKVSLNIWKKLGQVFDVIAQ